MKGTKDASQDTYIFLWPLTNEERIVGIKEMRYTRVVFMEVHTFEDDFLTRLFQHHIQPFDNNNEEKRRQGVALPYTFHDFKLFRGTPIDQDWGFSRR